MESKFIDLEFGKIHYCTSFNEHPYTLLFLHSFHSSAASFYHIDKELKKKMNVVCLDFQGHGLSSHIEDDQYFSYYSVEGTTSVLKAFLKQVPMENLIILGNSIGGNAAVRLLPKLQNVKGLVLTGSLQAKSSEEVFGLMYPKAPTDLLFQKELSKEQKLKLAKAYVFPNDSFGSGLDQMVDDISQTDPNFRKHLGESIPKEVWVNEIEILKKASMPLMYILGEKDGFIDTIKYRSYLESNGIDSQRVKIIEEAGHCPHLSTPTEFLHCIFSFMKKIVVI